MPVPLVLLPGMNCGPGLWSKPLAALRAEAAPRQVVVERLDRPSVGDQVEVLLARLPDRFALGGLSLGAIVAMAVHRLAPERVAGLFLLATNARPPTPAQQEAWQAQLDRLATGHTPRELQEDALAVLVGAQAAPDLSEQAVRLAVGSDELTAQLRMQQSRTDERPGLQAVNVPCTVVAPGADELCPLDRHTEIHSLAKGSELLVIPGAPHLATLSHPGAVATVVADWLRKVDEGRP